MSANKHTPGPWRLDDCGLFKSSRRVVKGAGEKSRSVCIVEDWTTEPDAHLIVAAPDLLAALEFIVNDAAPGEDTHLTVEGYNRACAAIAKARGES